MNAAFINVVDYREIPWIRDKSLSDKTVDLACVIILTVS